MLDLIIRFVLMRCILSFCPVVRCPVDSLSRCPLCLMSHQPVVPLLCFPIVPLSCCSVVPLSRCPIEQLSCCLYVCLTLLPDDNISVQEMLAHLQSGCHSGPATALPVLTHGYVITALSGALYVKSS